MKIAVFAAVGVAIAAGQFAPPMAIRERSLDLRDCAGCRVLWVASRKLGGYPARRIVTEKNGSLSIYEVGITSMLRI